MRYIIILIIFTFLQSCNSENQTKQDIQTIKELSKNEVNSDKELSIKILDKIPHDTNAYTQGLMYYNGYLYESTGQYGLSSLRKLDTNGNILKKVDIPSQFFAEGLTIFKNKIYLLTWMETVCFVYDIESFEKITEFRYHGQGWGLTNNNNDLIFSNGSNNIFVFDEKFSLKYNLPVYYGSQPQHYLNELEFVNDQIFANIYQEDFIALIDYKSGNLLQKIDASELRFALDGQENAEVLNGIAYNKDSDIFYLTGKNWKYLYKVKIN